MAAGESPVQEDCRLVLIQCSVSTLAYSASVDTVQEERARPVQEDTAATLITLDGRPIYGVKINFSGSLSINYHLNHHFVHSKIKITSKEKHCN